MQDTITTIDCVCAQVPETTGFQEDERSRVSDAEAEAEVKLLPLASALFHTSNHAKPRAFQTPCFS